MIKIAVVISGCGFLDGAEIFETIFTLLELDKHDASVKIFAPNQKQHCVINHLTGQAMTQERNILVESARIARGKIYPLSKLDVTNFNALILPGGAGVATSLSDLAFKNENAMVIDDLKSIIVQFYKSLKPIGAICIAPAILALALKEYTKVKITLGASNPLINKIGALEETCKANSIVVDHDNKLVTTPAFMSNAPLTKIHHGISNLVAKVIEMSCKLAIGSFVLSV
ncbi:isoprenoid biosynthesis glyoxalase ElbB [Cardinium endosymbiont of Oedothorax gibbosus]|uniref:isoprenoid biosynthesis glyoxalase ElbB n=1 Tax=Cardinium endosymbiont of Oedothorax gibbosus TaxID=931101 RepID=UPI002024363C|nr:isoprenoid biosynthesis glyoxalase ElbB [Cardinium endosymbiont of Oedothorax gibbosus]CAH2559764.1 Glyoxalase ElbB [Cardinium endosymbiont of Oedothorax gibbosus]